MRKLCLVVLLSLGSAMVSAQWTQQMGQRGFVPGAAFDHSTIDSVDMLNGNVVVRIPLTAMPLGHAGSSVDITLTYNSALFDSPYHWDSDWMNLLGNGVNAPYQATQLMPTVMGDALNGTWGYGYNYGLYEEVRSGNCVPNGMGGWDLSPPTQPEALYPYRLRAVFPDGSLHVLYLENSTNFNDADGNDGWFGVSDLGTPTSCSNGASPVALPLHYLTVDGTYLRVDITSTPSQVPVWVMRFPDGRVVNGQGFSTNSISDRNGNVITITRSADGGPSPAGCPLEQQSGDPATWITDAGGRCILIENGYGGVPANTPFTDFVAQAGPNGTQNLWTLKGAPPVGLSFAYEYGAANLCQYGYEDRCDVEDFTCAAAGECSTNRYVPAYSELDLPDGQSYLFGAFNSQGQVTQITLPKADSWAAATIQYSFDPPGICNTLGVAATCDPQDMPIVTKTLSHHDPLAGTALSDVWNYGVGYTVQTGSQTSAVMHPDGGIVRNYFNCVYLCNFPGLTYEIDQPDGSRTQRIWAYNTFEPGAFGPANPLIASEYDSVANSGTPTLTAATNYSYDSNGNLTEVDQFPWINYPFSVSSHDPVSAPNSLTSAARTTKNTYWLPADTGANQGNGYWNPYPSTPQLLNARTSTLVSESALQSYSELVYDSATSTGNVLNKFDWDSTKAGFPGQISSGASPTYNLSTINAIKTAWTYTSGDILTETDPLVIEKAYTYGQCSGVYPSQVTEGSGARTFTFTWDCASGLRTGETDSDNGTTTTVAYDQLGRQTNVTRANGQQIDTTYDDSAQTTTTQTQPDLTTPMAGWIQTVTYRDDLQRAYQTTETSDVSGCSLITTQSTQGVAYGSLFSYQLASNPFCSGADSTMGWTVTESDSMGRVVNVSHSPGSTIPSPGSPSSCSSNTCYSYGANSTGSTTAVTDEAGVSRATSADSLGRMTQVLDGSGLTTYYGYALSNLVSVTQVAQSRTFGYSSLNRLLSATNPENGTICYNYDADGNLSSIGGNSLCTPTRPATETLTYNSLNQVLSKNYSDGTPSVSYTYGTTGSHCPSSLYSVGRTCSVSNSASTTSFGYNDQTGKVTTSTQTTPSSGGTSYGFSYAYNLNDGLVQETYPSQRVVSYGYNSAGRVNKVVQGALDSPVKTYAGSISYAPQHALASMSLGSNIIAESWQYNFRLQPTQIQANGATSLTLCYRYSGSQNACDNSGQGDTVQNNGNVLWANIARSGVSSAPTYAQVFSYDGLNRLTQALENTGSPCSSSTTDWCQSFSYTGDGSPSPGIYGNRTVTSQGSAVVSPSPQTFNAATNHIADSGWSYDAAGNVTADPSPATYAYDFENHQKYFCANTTSACSSGTTMAYLYDGDGNRVQTVGSTTTTFVYDAMGHMAAEYGSQALPCSETCYVNVDSLGSTRMVTDQSGDCQALLDYTPFGQLIPSTSSNPRGGTCYPGTPPPPRQQFTSKERDPESGLDYFLARYYSSPQGRFTSPDVPLYAQSASDPQSWNLYAYSRNSPLINVDPDGRDCVTTRNQTAESVEVGIAPGRCQPNEGADVPGIINTSSLAYNGNTISYSYTPDNPAAMYTGGTIELGQLGGGDELSDFAKGALGQAGVWSSNGQVFRDALAEALPYMGMALGMVEGGEPGGEAPSVNWNAQEKHFEGHNSYTPGRSTLTADPRELAGRAGTGQPVNSVPTGQPGYRERVDFGKVIGNYVDPNTGASVPTTKGVIHYAADGIHVVPARP